MTDSGGTAAGTAATGMLIGGRYRLHERLGRGGMGTVWRATDERLCRQVALKEPVLPDGVDAREREERFRRMKREAQAAATLRHPSIVGVHDIETVDGRPWLVMELIEGESLEAVPAAGTLSVREAAGIGREIAAEVVHRHAEPAPATSALPRPRAVACSPCGPQELHETVAAARTAQKADTHVRART
ncbi:protein kinase domain-containing protein [Kitasatospora aureofaciens]|uniref:protein kinase domain-containing protein n=1 Tax=Kitasatospora aureofaciens TaxID=1894 RepID=UPI000524A7C4